MWTPQSRMSCTMQCLLEILRDCGCPSDGALHYAAATDNVEGVQFFNQGVRLLIARGWDVNLLDQNGFTPVMLAMVLKKVNVLRELVSHPSVDLDTKNRIGWSLEDMARWTLDDFNWHAFYFLDALASLVSTLLCRFLALAHI